MQEWDLSVPGCRYSRCSVVEALEVASLHPARALGIEKKKGTLNVSSSICDHCVHCSCCKFLEVPTNVV